VKLDFSPSRAILQIFFDKQEADKMVADALVYHPTVSHYLKFVATTGTFLNIFQLYIFSITYLHYPNLSIISPYHHPKSSSFTCSY
jgi:hypothetical protein